MTNLGKYKERNTKLSIHCLNPEDKENLFKIFEKNQEIDENSEENHSIDDMNILITKIKSLKNNQFSKYIKIIFYKSNFYLFNFFEDYKFYL